MPDPSVIKARMNRLALLSKASAEWQFTDKGKWELFNPETINHCTELRLRPSRITERVLTPSWQTKHWATDKQLAYTNMGFQQPKKQQLTPILGPDEYNVLRRKAAANANLQTENSEYRHNFQAGMNRSQSMPKSFNMQKQCQKWANSQVNAEWRFTNRGVYELYEPGSNQALCTSSLRFKPQRLTQKKLDSEWKLKHRRPLGLSAQPEEKNALSSQERLFLIRNCEKICPDPVNFSDEE